MILCFGELVFIGRIDCVLVVIKLNWRVGFRVEKRIDLGDFDLVFMGV